MDNQKGRLILGGVILVALAALMLWLYSDDLFSSGVTSPAASAAAGNNGSDTGDPAEPNAPAPPPRTGGRMAAPKDR